MNKYVYSAKENAFFPESLREQYELAHSWPDDGVEVTEEYFESFSITPPGKMRVAGDNGLPVWVDVPPPSQEELIAANTKKLQSLRKDAGSEIAWRQDAVDAEIATDEEVADLAAWKKYRALLMRVDTSNPEWPELPE